LWQELLKAPQTQKFRQAPADALEAQQKKLAKLARSPYFGRVDFQDDQNPSGTEAIYAGVHHFRD
jgi:DNA helicase IV